MNAFSLRIAAVCFFFVASLANAQSKNGLIGSSFDISNPTIATIQLVSISLTFYYPTGLAPNSYISSAQLTTDFQGAAAAYPSPQDPMEAILSTALAAVLKKYPQISGGSIYAFIPGPTVGGVPTLGGSISVEIGLTLAGTVPTVAQLKHVPKL